MARRVAASRKASLDTGKPTPSQRASYAWLLWQAGECSQALGILKALMQEAPDNLSAQADYTIALVSCGRPRVEAQEIAEALIKVERPFLRGGPRFQRARIPGALGDREGAVSALRAAFAQGRGWPINLEPHLHTAFEGFRDYPPLIELMKPG